MHIMHSNIGHEMSSVFLQLHVLTGCDVTSKRGTKYGTLNAKPIDYLKRFGQSKNVCHKEAEKAESYLVKVLRPSPACITKNELCIESYLDKSSYLIELPPTSLPKYWDIWAYSSISFCYSSVLESFECDWEVQCSRIWMDWSWRWMFYTRQMLITNTSLLYHQMWMQKRMFPTLPVFVCRYKMHWVLCW